ncbi:MAG TPA: cytochrome c [Steroidobacteraceae bacterium]|jgi:cytochrome c556
MAKFAGKKSTLLLIAVGVAIAAPAGILLAHDDNATGIFKVRHDEYHKLGDAFKTVRDQSQSSTPDMAKIKTAAQVVNDASINQFKWFPAGSGPESGHKTRAKADIWAKPQDFEAAQKRFGAQGPKLLAAANSGDANAVKAQFEETAKACKNCHDTFRAPEEKH